MDKEQELNEKADEIFERLSEPCEKFVTFTENVLLKVFSYFLENDDNDNE